MPRNRTIEGEGRDPRLVEVGARIKRGRLGLGLDQKDLAQIVGVTEKTVSNWEIGHYSPHRSIGAISAALNVSESWLWHGTAEAPDQDHVVMLLEEHSRLLRQILDELRLARLDKVEGRRMLDGDHSIPT